MNETVLLCENCGYVLDGLSAEGKCPECGSDIAASLPERRTGSAWQEGGGAWAWAHASMGVLLRARATFRSIKIESRRSRRLLLVNLLLGAAALGFAGARLLGYDRHLGTGAGTTVGWCASFGALTVLGYLLLAGLTRIESAGVQFFGRQRGWRVTPTLATAVCAHASVGWAAGGLGVLAVSVFWQAHWAPSTPLVQRLTTVPNYWVWAPSIFGVFFAGLLLFEVLVYIGVRECRFANPPGAGKPGADQAGRASG